MLEQGAFDGLNGAIGPPIEPAFARPYDQLSRIDAAFVSGDGKHIYAIGWARVVDFGKMINNSSRVVLPELVISLLLIAGYWFLRANRDSRLAGVKYCRRCRYELTGLDAGGRPLCCPECGVDVSKKRPIVGKSRFRRLGPPSIAVMLAVWSAAWFFAGGQSAPSPPLPFGRWGSFGLERVFERLGIDSGYLGSDAGLLELEIDAHSGDVRHERWLRDAWLDKGEEFVFDQRSGNFIIHGQARVALIDAASGAVIAEYSPEATLAACALVYTTFAGSSMDGACMYIIRDDHENRTWDLLEWDWRHCTARSIYHMANPMLLGCDGKAVYALAGDGHRVFVLESWPDQSTLRGTIVDGEGRLLATRDMGSFHPQFGFPDVLVNQGVLALHRDQIPRLELYDDSSLAAKGERDLPAIRRCATEVLDRSGPVSIHADRAIGLVKWADERVPTLLAQRNGGIGPWSFSRSLNDQVACGIIWPGKSDSTTSQWLIVWHLPGSRVADSDP